MSLIQWPPMPNKTGPKPCVLTAWKCYVGSSVPWDKYTSHNEVSTWRNHDNNWNGNSKRGKKNWGRNLTGRNKGQPGWPTCAAEATARLLCAPLLCGPVRVWFCLCSKKQKVLLVCLFALAHAEDREDVCLVCDSPHSIYMYPPLKYTYESGPVFVSLLVFISFKESLTLR